MLQAAIARERGLPDHIEHDDETAHTDFDERGRVIAIHTPQETLIRIHETMHANHTNRRRYEKAYANVNDHVRQISEDCRLHLKHWPWKRGNTPDSIRQDVSRFMVDEIARCNAKRDNPDPKSGNQAWPQFAVRFRVACIDAGMNRGGHAEVDRVGLRDSEGDFAKYVADLFRTGREKEAAELLQSVFFPPTCDDGEPGESRKPEPGEQTTLTRKKRGRDGGSNLTMQVMELPHTEAIESAVRGYRVARSGRRLHRPAVRKPVLPARLFVRRDPIKPGGTILIDASGSMGPWDTVRKWCEHAPFATVAYYAGFDDEGGWLYVYARDGYRAAKLIETPGRDNTVDGLALDWLLAQPGPRYMVTDREFCGAEDSPAQIVRLANLEAAGVVKVLDYAPGSESDDESD